MPNNNLDISLIPNPLDYLEHYNHLFITNSSACDLVKNQGVFGCQVFLHDRAVSKHTTQFIKLKNTLIYPYGFHVNNQEDETDSTLVLVTATHENAVELRDQLSDYLKFILDNRDDVEGCEVGFSGTITLDIN